MYSDVFANDVRISNFNSAFRFGRKTQVLGRASNDCAVGDKISGTDPDCAFDHDLRLHNRPRTNFDLVANKGIGANLDVISETSTWTNDRRRMNLQSTPASLKLKYGCRFSAGAPMIR